MRRLIGILLLALTSVCSATTRYIAQTAGVFSGGTACNGQTAITPATFNATTIASGDIAYVCGTLTGAAGASGLITPHNGGSTGNPVKILGDTGNLMTAPVWGPGTGAYATGGAINITHGQTTVSGVNITATLSGASGTSCFGGLCTYDRSTAGIVVSGGLTGVSIQNNSITNIYLCNNAAACNTSWYSAGILVGPSGAATTFDISGNTIDGVGTEIFFEYSGAALSGINIHNNTLGASHGGYWGIAMGCGSTGCTTASVNIYANTINGCADWNGQYNNGGAGNGYHCDGVIVYSNASAQPFSIYNNTINFVGALTADVFCTYGATSPGATCTIFNNVLIVQNSVCAGVGGGRALWFHSGTSGHVIVNNTVLGANASCYLMELESGATVSTIENNIWTQENWTGEYLATGTTAFGTTDYNDYYTPSGTRNLNGTLQSFAAWQGLGFDAHGINTNPNLDYQYRLQTGAGAINAGINLTSLGITALNSDASGAARPSSGAWDMGAYEFSSGTIFTAVQGNGTTTGDWQDWHTWWASPPSGTGCHFVYPCSTDSGDAGDRVIIPAGITVTCGLTATETCSAGTSPPDQVTFAISLTGSAGGLTCANASSITYAGPVQAVDGNVLTLGPGCTLYHDSSWNYAAPTTAAYTFKWGTSSAGGRWAFNGNAGSHVTWQGGSMLGPRHNPGAICTTSTSNIPGNCLAGGINFTGAATCPTNIGYGTQTYVDYWNIGGTKGSNSYFTAMCLATGSSTSLGTITLTHVTFNNSTVFRFLVGSNDVNSIVLTNIELYHCADADSCMHYGGASSSSTGATGCCGAASYTITGLLTDGEVSAQTGSSFSPFISTNFMSWGGQYGGNAHLYFGGISDNGYHDQWLAIDQAWNAGPTQTLVYFVVPLNMSNSVLWGDRQTSLTAHTNFAKAQFDHANAALTSNNKWVNNVLDSLAGGLTTGLAPTTPMTYLFQGNVLPCRWQYSGYGGQGLVGGYVNGAFAASNVSITSMQNTQCNISNLGGSGGGSTGAIGFEASAFPPGTIASANSNLFYSMQAGGNAMTGVQGPTTSGSSPIAVTYYGDNYVTNATSWQQIYPGNSYVQTLGTDTVTSKPFVTIDSWRTVPFFDYQYLTPMGLLNVASYGATPWASGTVYNVGQVVSVSDPSAWNGRITYWRCILSHTSNAFNEPVLGIDNSNPFAGPSQYWEHAMWQWARTQVINNVTFDTQCAALLHVTCPTPHTYLSGLIAAWVRSGYISLDPATWLACSPDRGVTKIECGAVPLPPIRHIAPAMAVN